MLNLTYKDAVQAARELLYEQIRDPEGESNPEYTRGICELLAVCFGRTRDEVAYEIGVELTDPTGMIPPKV